MNKQLYSKKDGMLDLYEVEIIIKNLGNSKFWAKHKGVKDHFLFPVNNILVSIEPYKENIGLSKEDENPKMRIGSHYRLVLKRID